MRRQRTGVVMIEIAHGYPGFEQSDQILAVLMERDVEHRNVVAGSPLDATQQFNVALYAGDERSSLRFSETKLLQGAQAVGVAVERVVASHIALTGPRSRILSRCWPSFGLLRRTQRYERLP